MFIKINLGKAPGGASSESGGVVWAVEAAGGVTAPLGGRSGGWTYVYVVDWTPGGCVSTVAGSTVVIVRAYVPYISAGAPSSGSATIE